MIRFGSYLQTNWDWRAAGNFVFGGAGGALLAVIALAEMGRSPSLPVGLTALALVGLGLLLVWLEIGRPWRALNVFFHPQTSWMSREAAVATVLFPLTLAAIWIGNGALFMVAGALGALFLFCQGRILHGSRGIPAWREPAVVPLIVSTGLAEGVALLMLLFGYFGGPTASLLNALVIALVLRSWAFFHYRAALERAQASAATLNRIASLRVPFLLVGNALPVVIGLVAALFWRAALLELAAILALIGGWYLKFVIVTSAAQVQGYGIGKLQRGRPTLRKPVRRDGDPWRA
ncbi:MAG: dimethyl sulfoxide reductase anchor subunit [Gammaproteobacteria bacterium]|nr:dimethyl sulfoxide reductase anchor subunit [Gammaproteobacteria bacterium]